MIRLSTIKHQWKNTQKIAFLFLAPWLIGITFFSLMPMFMSLYYSFTNFNMFNNPQIVGAVNYMKMFSDVRFQRSIAVTTRYVLIGVPLQLSFALFLSLLLNIKIPGFRIFRVIYYIPSLMGGSVAIAFLWKQIFGMSGLLNHFLVFLGITRFNDFSWLNNVNTAVYMLVLLLVWQFGSCMVIFIAGIQNIPETLYEAAEIDGANRLMKFSRITFPMLTPIIFFNLVMQIINAFQAFTPVFIISGGTGGFRDSVLFYTLYLYRQGFIMYDMGYASALAWFLLLLIGLIAALLFASSRFWVFYDE